MSLIVNLTPTDSSPLMKFLPKRDSNKAPSIPTGMSLSNINKLHNKREKSPFHSDLAPLSTTSFTPQPHPPERKLTHARSLGTEEEELQNSLKKIPKVSKKLPPAFGGIFQKSTGHIAKKIPLGNIQPKVEPLPNLGSILEASEYKQTTGLLSPLKHRSLPRDKEDDNSILLDKQERKSSRNPLIPLKNFMILSKMDEEFREQSNISIDKLEKIYRIHKDHHVQTTRRGHINLDIKLNELVTLSMMKSAHATGSIRKMIHAPTLRLFAVKEVPLTTREVRNNLKDWLNSWQATFENSPRHLKVYNTYFNSPEGCLSIVMELVNGGSVQNLLESVGNLPETAIKSLASQTLEAIEDLHSKLNTPHGGISPSQLLLDKNGNVKLSLGLLHRTHSSNSGSVANTLIKNPFDKLMLYELTPINNPSSFQRPFLGGKDGNDSNKLALAQDIFDFGFLMLICAVGGLDFFESSEFMEKARIFLDELAKKPQERSKYCCLIHNEDLIASVKLPNHEEAFLNNKPVRVIKASGLVLERVPKPTQITIQDFLKTQNFSQEFIDFLCSCLKFDPQERPSLKTLMKSPFITNKNTKGPAVSLSDLLKISNTWSKNSVLPSEYQGYSERQLNKLVETLTLVLPNCEKLPSKFFDEFEMLTPNSQVILDLANELGLPALKVWKRVEGLYKSSPKHMQHSER